MSDPFDDDDDFFANPETLSLLVGIEERAVQASQAPAPPPGPTTGRASSVAPASSTPKVTQPVHHAVSRPKFEVRRGAQAGAPGGERVGASVAPTLGMGRGARASASAGMRGGRAAEQREREDAVRTEERRQPATEYGESLPPDFVVDSTGRYELGAVGEGTAGQGEAAQVTDDQRAQRALPSQSTGAYSGLAGEGVRTGAGSGADADEARARRARAISEALASGDDAPSSRPASRAPHPPTHSRQSSQTFNPNPNRPFARSASAGSHIFGPRGSQQGHAAIGAGAGPSRLPTIPSQSEHSISASERGSQLAMQRQAAELQRERSQRKAIEAELQTLRTQAQAAQRASSSQNGRANGSGGEAEKKLKEMQRQIWTAKGEAENIRRTQKEEHARHVAEIEKLRAALAEKDAQMKERENQQKRVVESIKHQAVFSNHALQTSAMKTRPQSQRFPQASQSQFRALPTPIRNGSPGRHGGMFDMDVTPLARSVKGKGKAPPPPPPTFGHFHNAFASTPTVNPRAKRQKTQHTQGSPHASPSKNPTKPVSGSPFQSSPSSRSRNVGSSPGGMDGDGEEEVWFDGEGDEAGMGRQTVDERAELLYHLFNHLSVSPYHALLGLEAQPTLYVILNYHPPEYLADHEQYTRACSELLRACGDSELEMSTLVNVLAKCLGGMMAVLGRALIESEKVTLHEAMLLCGVTQLLASSTYLFPSFIPAIAEHNVAIPTMRLLTSAIYDVQRLLALRRRIEASLEPAVEDDSPVAAPTTEASRKTRGWDSVLVDAIAQLCEAMCWFGDGSGIWRGDDLVDILLGLLSSSHEKKPTNTNNEDEEFAKYLVNKDWVKRGVDVFFAAACNGNHFRLLIAPSEAKTLPGWADLSPVLERVCAYLIKPHPLMNRTENLVMNLAIVRGLYTMARTDTDAVILMGSRGSLVPALITVIDNESSRIWGVHAELPSLDDALALLCPTLFLLHHLVLPPPLLAPASPSHSTSLSQARTLPSSSQALPDIEGPSGINLADAIQDGTVKVNGLQHLFVSALGRMTYGLFGEVEGGEDGDGVSEIDIRWVQALSNDLLEQVVEGPEEDSIYELYVDAEDEMMDEDGAVAGMVDEEAYAEMDPIEIDEEAE